MRRTTEKFFCDNCDRELDFGPSQIDIATSKMEGISWARLHVSIQLISGVHNDSETKDADLCKNCAMDLLEDAVKRIKKGERATEGTLSSTELGWVEPS